MKRDLKWSLFLHLRVCAGGWLIGPRFSVVLLLMLGCAGSVQGQDEESSALGRFDFRDVIRDAKQAVFPTVVFVRAVRETLQGGQTLRQEVSGSGVLISPAGEFLSNWHVIDKAQEIRCMLHDGRAFSARVLASDKDLDLALLQLEWPPESGEPLPYARLGNSDAVEEGDFVMAMGAPWGLSRSVSIGIISSSRRYLPTLSEYNHWLQTDASISPGNSGGPLVNTEGDVIGINTRGILIGGDTGFAIPSSVIQELLPAMRQEGRINWNYTGLLFQPLNDFNRNIYFDYTEGLMVASVDPASPAERAGILTGDRVLAIGEHPVTARFEEDLSDVRRSLGLLPLHVPVSFDLMRGAVAVQAWVTPVEKGTVEGDSLDCPRWDFTVKVINRFDTPDLFFYRREGVFVYGVRHPGNAQRAGLQPRDIILEIDGSPVASLEEVRQHHAQAMTNLEERTRAFLTILRGGQRRQLVLEFSRDFQMQ